MYTKVTTSFPHPHEVQERTAGCTIFSTLYLHSGYWQLPAHKEDQEKTAFYTGPGFILFQSCRMPFGFLGAPALLQKLMDRIYHDFPIAITYLDDLLIHLCTLEEHKDHQYILFEHLVQARLTVCGENVLLG